MSTTENDQAEPGARSTGDPNAGPRGGMEPQDRGLNTRRCVDPSCQWNQPGDAVWNDWMGAPQGWTWPHHHEGDALVLHIDYA